MLGCEEREDPPGLEGVEPKMKIGKTAILDAEPTSSDQRVPAYVGNSQLVSQFEELAKKNAQSPREAAEIRPENVPSEVRARE